ncbi:helix-turn-helix transcriptional regulator [Streptomonospora sp. PA3]|uniref:helix-turn-helix domain-containing protein n=1 Tax=Streptomonospora sp. PA3 TaxID=2607326 RepID=UPI0012DC57DB|nr:helix-turn-helix transcriptional regulator [Streptomonospora sp. PA3]MUL41405.1 helix-turn-helix transcriptional regulator [Streptomonospora sp. PA3]
MTVTTEPVGALLRGWRERRRRSQLDVSIAADVSTRHLSYIETGRANPSREMIERLCDELDVPLRERNTLYLAAGFAPAHAERPFTDLGAAGDAVRSVLAGQEPNPSLAVNVCWELLAANRAMSAFLRGVPAELTRPAINVLRVTLHPDGLARRIRNLAQWRRHVLRRVRRQLDRTAAPGLAELLAELEGYPDALPGGASESSGPGESGESGGPEPAARAGGADRSPIDDIAVPMRMATEYGDLALLYTTTVFGSPRDVTLDEIAVETFYPADPATADLLRALAE